MNIQLFRIINSWAGQNNFLDVFFVIGAKYVIFLIILIAVVFLFFREYRRSAIRAFVVAAVAVSFNYLVLSSLFFRQRPYLILENVNKLVEHFSEKSFPSDHATVAFGVALTIFLFHRRIGLPLVILAVWVAFGRVFVGVHLPGDVVGGLIVALFFTLVINHKFGPRLRDNLKISIK
ncbi:MAG TPA: phosphatase PAP2 family protein [Patescibacteria group bacterium]